MKYIVNCISKLCRLYLMMEEDAGRMALYQQELPRLYQQELRGGKLFRLRRLEGVQAGHNSLHYSHSKLLYTTGRQLVTQELAGNGESSLDLGATVTSFTVGLEQKEESGTGRRVVPAAVEAASVRWVEEHPALTLTWDSVATSLDLGLNLTYTVEVENLSYPNPTATFFAASYLIENDEINKLIWWW